MKLQEVIDRVGGKLLPDNTHLERSIKGINTLEQANQDEISFLSNPRYSKHLASTKACAVILAKHEPSLEIPQIVHPNPYAAMATIAQQFFQRQHSYSKQSSLAYVHPEADVSPEAVVYPFAYIDAGASIASGVILYPGVFIGPRASIGNNSVLYANAVVLADCHLGEDCLVHPGAVIGGDGFGFAPTGGDLIKIPQVGGVSIGSDVEIGSNSTVDRGAFDDTEIANGCKLDSQVHIAHGVKLGRNAMLCGQTEIAGSTRVGDNLIMAGQSAIGPSLEVGDHITLGPRAGLTNSHKESGTFMGMPLSPIKDWRRQAVVMKQLPEVLSRLRKLEAELAALKQASNEAGD